MNVKNDDAKVPDGDAVESSRMTHVQLTDQQYEDLVELAYQTKTTLAELLRRAFADYVPAEIERLKKAGRWRERGQRSEETLPPTPPVMPPSSEVN